MLELDRHVSTIPLHTSLLHPPATSKLGHISAVDAITTVILQTKLANAASRVPDNASLNFTQKTRDRCHSDDYLELYRSDGKGLLKNKDAFAFYKYVVTD